MCTANGSTSSRPGGRFVAETIGWPARLEGGRQQHIEPVGAPLATACDRDQGPVATVLAPLPHHHRILATARQVPWIESRQPLFLAH
jgi:hypothetical protein